MRDRRLAVRYAKALLSVLSDPAEAEAADAFLTSVSAAMGQSAELRTILLDPAVPRDQRRQALRALADAKSMPRTVGNFFASLVDHNRTSAIPAIAEMFHEVRQAHLGIVPAEMTTATPMSSEQQAHAERAIRKLTGKNVHLVCSVDPELIGGAVTRIGSTVYDGSLRNQLTQLRSQMVQE
jgi:F-type H+-transporting ATPase subunit delta